MTRASMQHDPAPIRRSSRVLEVLREILVRRYRLPSSDPVMVAIEDAIERDSTEAYELIKQRISELEAERVASECHRQPAGA